MLLLKLLFLRHLRLHRGDDDDRENVRSRIRRDDGGVRVPHDLVLRDVHVRIRSVRARVLHVHRDDDVYVLCESVCVYHESVHDVLRDYVHAYACVLRDYVHAYACVLRGCEHADVLHVRSILLRVLYSYIFLLCKAARQAAGVLLESVKKIAHAIFSLTSCV